MEARGLGKHPRSREPMRRDGREEEEGSVVLLIREDNPDLPLFCC